MAGVIALGCGETPSGGELEALLAAADQRVIVSLRGDLADAPETARRLAHRYGAVVDEVFAHVLVGFVAVAPGGARRALCADPAVRRCDDDLVVWAVCHTGPEITPSNITRIGAPLNTTPLPVNADIAILDTGVDGKSADANVFRAFNCTLKGSCSDLGAGTSAKDGNGHGTHVMGIAAAVQDADRIRGTAAGARVWSFKVLTDQGMGLTSWIIKGLDKVAQHADSIEVANLSLGGASSEDPSSCGSSSFHQAICKVTQAGVPLAVAAGNSSDDAANYVPAKYGEVLTVSALDGDTDTFAGFSNFGAAVDLVAPGVAILSLTPSSKSVPGGQCTTMSGTSMAAPHVAGAVALWAATHGRDCNGDALLDGADTECIGAALKLAGRCPGGASPAGTGLCPSAWAGDPDAFYEPLVSVASPF
jgi:subtilisin family serine protease